MSPLLPKWGRDGGFTLLEVIVAIVVLAVGMLSAALLAERIMASGRSSKYMSTAAMLASEKLEDLNRWDAQMPWVCVPTGSTTAGSLSSDILQSVTCGALTEDVNYYDDINITLNTGGTDCPSSTAGCFAETVSSVSGGNTVYTTTYHSADGTVQASAPTSTPPSASTFHRRWVIELSPVINGLTVTGARRVTVLVTLTDATVHPPVTFQMSMVRP